MENKSNTCILVQEILPIYMDGCLSDECKMVIQAHIHTCKECKNKLAKIKENEDEPKEDSISEIQEKQNFSSLSKKMKHHRIKSMVMTIGIMCILFLTYITCFTTSIMTSNSMYPAIEAEENCVIFRYAYTFAKPKRDDIICVKVDTGFGDSFCISRVVGMPGDTVEISAGKLFINGEEQISYQGITSPDNFFPVIVGENSYFLISDNFANAYDSRNFGSVNMDNIYGKCLFYGGLLKNPFVETSIATATSEID